MYIVIVALTILVCVGLIFIVLIQNPKGGGLAGNLAGAQMASQFMGVRRAADVVEKLTWWLIGIMALITLIANIVLFSFDEASNPNDLRMKSALEVNTAPTAAPTAPKTPGATPSQQQAPAAAPAQGGAPAATPAPAEGAPAGN